MLTLYRRHNPENCKSTDTQKCDPKAHCPIWIRGTKDGKYVRVPTHMRDWNRAVEVLRQFEATGEVGPAPVPEQDRATIERWRDEFLKDSEARGVEEETRRKYKILFGKLSRFADGKGIRFVDELDLGRLQEFRQTWKDLSKLTKVKEQERLRSIFKFAHARLWTSHNPALDLGKIVLKEGDHPEVKPFTEAEMEKILKAAREQNDGGALYAFILVMRYSGLRISDVCQLKDENIQGDRLAIKTQKMKTTVKIPMDKTIIEALKTIPRKSKEYIFWNGTKSLEAAKDEWRTDRLKPLFESAGIKDGHPHRFRHTFVCALLKVGAPVGHIASLLGNTERIVEKHYKRWIDERQKPLDEILKKANATHVIKPFGESRVLLN